MEEIEHLLRVGRGVVTSEELNAVGATRHAIRKAINERRLCRISRGRYTTPALLASRPDDVVTVARMLNGSVTALSALQWHQLWVPLHRETHIRVTPRVSEHIRDSPERRRLLAVANVVLHTRTRPKAIRAANPDVDDPSVSMLTAERVCSSEELVAIGDSALRKGATVEQLLYVSSFGGPRLRRAFAQLDGRAGSGVESILRVRLNALRVKVTPQAQVGRWPVDFLVGAWLIIEVDGRRYHSEEDEFTRDRVKDRELNAAGYTVLRFTYWQIMSEWARSEQEILAFVRAGRHLRPNYRKRTSPTKPQRGTNSRHVLE